MNAPGSDRYTRAITAVLTLLFLITLGLFLSANYRAGDSAPLTMLVNGLLLSVPLGLLYLSAGLLAAAARQRRLGGRIAPRLARFLYYAPRTAGVLIILFLSMFALDAFETPGSVWHKLGAFAIHLAPSLVMAALLAVAWRHARVGFFLFLLAALIFLRFVIPAVLRGEPGAGLGSMLLFSGPMAAIAALFWVNWQWKDELKPANPAA